MNEQALTLTITVGSARRLVLDTARALMEIALKLRMKTWGMHPRSGYLSHPRHRIDVTPPLLVADFVSQLLSIPNIR